MRRQREGLWIVLPEEDATTQTSAGDTTLRSAKRGSRRVFPQVLLQPQQPLGLQA